MSFKKNQKNYNKQVMRTGEQANRYLNNALGLINQYTSDYAGRNDFWLSKLNDRQLNLLSDSYLKQNADLLRGSAAFGSNSALNQQVENNAYTQQNYLANTANKNVMDANTLQDNELTSLMNASKTYESPIAAGASAAQNVDAANTSWANMLGQGLSTAGKVVSFIPGYGQAIGAGMQLAGNTLTSMSSEATGLDAAYQQQQQNLAQRFVNGGTNTPGVLDAFTNLSNRNKSGDTTLSNINTNSIADEIRRQTSFNKEWR